MNFDEKDSMLFDDKEKKTTGFPFIVVALLLCIIAGLVIFVLKRNGIDFNFKSVNTSRVWMFAFTLGTVMVRITGMFFLLISLRAAYRKIILDDSSIYWYKIIICMMMGSTLMILGSSIIMVFATLLTDIYY